MKTLLLREIISKVLYGKKYSELTMEEKKKSLALIIILMIISASIGWGFSELHDYYKNLREERREEREFKKVVGTLYIYNNKSSNNISYENIVLELHNGKHEVFENIKFKIMFPQFYQKNREYYNIKVLENRTWIKDRARNGSTNFPNETIYYWDYVMYNETLRLYLNITWNNIEVQNTSIKPQWNILLGEKDIKTKKVKYEIPLLP